MIVIATDNVSKDSMRISLMKMSTPAGIKLKICPVDDAAQYLMSDKAKSRNIDLLVDSPKDAYRIPREVEGWMTSMWLCSKEEKEKGWPVRPCSFRKRMRNT